MRILIVDDIKENLYILEALLKGSGYEVVSAENGAEALEKLRTESIDIIVSDVLMPVMDGFKLCKEVKGKGELKNIPFIFYTATYQDERDEKLASKLGADKYILKPAEPEELVNIIQGVIRDVEEGKFEPRKLVVEEEEEVFKLYSERLVNKLEKKMLELEKEITVRKQAEKRIEHLNLVLRAIRNVNQLIVREKNRDRLIQGACSNFIKNRGFYSAWIALIDKSHRLVTVAEAGLGKAFQPLLKNLKQGNFPSCMQRALAKPGILTIKGPASTCGDCPLVNTFKETGVFSSRLEHDGNIYGILTVSFPTEYASVKEDLSLFEEIAGDIAFALNHIELEESRKKAGEQIKASLREKEVLLQEVHHRVKNNMQIISSLLRLQSRKIKGKRALQAFESSCNRVKSMVLIHERLYQSRDFARVDFAEYVHGLTNHLLSLHKIGPETVKLDINIKDIFLDLSTAIPCGLIVNELVSNSLRHAFLDGGKGKIKIVMKSLKENEVEMIVSDNGVGLPEDVDFKKTESLGLHLVTILAEDQLRGTIKLDKTKGTRFEIKFKTKQ